MSDETLIEIFDKKDFRNWLKKNYNKEKKVGLILHKKHTGKSSPSHKELMFEAICFGWIDTTIKRVDEDKYIRYFTKRNEKSTWSYNTLGYAEQLSKEGKMHPHGLHFYNEGKKKKPHDFGIPKEPEIPEELNKILNKNKNLKEKFQKIAPSQRKTYLRWIFRAKLPETKNKRIDIMVERISQGKSFGMSKDI